MTFVPTIRDPLADKFHGQTIQFRPLTPESGEGLGRFTRSLADSDLMFTRMDIADPEVVAEWLENVARGRTHTLLIEEDGQIQGYGSLHFSPVYWTRHMAEIRLLVTSRLRGKGIGRYVVNALCDVAKERGMRRVIAQIPATQPKVRYMFEHLGFQPVALLTDWLKDRHGQRHDLLVLARNLD